MPKHSGSDGFQNCVPGTRLVSSTFAALPTGNYMADDTVSHVKSSAPQATLRRSIMSATLMAFRRLL